MLETMSNRKNETVTEKQIIPLPSQAEKFIITAKASTFKDLATAHQRVVSVTSGRTYVHYIRNTGFIGNRKSYHF